MPQLDSPSLLHGIHQDGTATPDLWVEVVGTLAAVCETVPLLAEQGPPTGSAAQHAVATPTWNTLLVGADMFGLLQTALTSPLDDDALLETAALAGALAGHEPLASQLAESGAVRRSGAPRVHACRLLCTRWETQCLHGCAAHLSQLQALAALMGKRFQDDEFVLQVGRFRGTGRVACTPACSATLCGSHSKVMGSF